MPLNVAQKLIAAHLVDGSDRPGTPITLKIDQTLTQDATGTLVMLALEAIGIDRVSTEVSVQYVDHNLLEIDNLNADDHLFLESACRRFGVWYSPPGNGISHVLHMAHFGKPGKSLLGSDSHTPAAGALGMLAIGAGGLDVALAMSGEPFPTTMPAILGVRLKGDLPEWVSAKDVILEMLRRRGVSGGVGKIVEYFGPGLSRLSAMDRHVIANMGAELGATTTVFPSDQEVRRFLRDHGRADDWQEITADAGCRYDEEDEIDLSSLEPLIATPSSPANVVKVADIAGKDIYQSYIGSSANPGWRDFAVAAEIVRGKTVPSKVSFDINPTSRQVLETLIADGRLGALVAAGARIHQTGCNGCIGIGQAPAIGRRSLRTTPRNFPGRSGTKEDSVFLCSPETAAASALSGRITDPRSLEMPFPRLAYPEPVAVNPALLAPPPPAKNTARVELVKGPNIRSFPDFDPLPNSLAVPVLLKMGDDVSTDEILPAGAKVLPYRSNIQKIEEFAFEGIDATYPKRARAMRDKSGHAVVAGRNYGQGSSREHAAAAPRDLGLRVVLAKSFARIHRQNLVNFGVLPLTFGHAEDYDRLRQGDILQLRDLHRALQNDADMTIECGGPITVRHGLTRKQADVLLAGGLINWRRKQQRAA
ncbi:MAG: aconitate hydratase [Pseudolabrys sp.]